MSDVIQWMSGQPLLIAGVGTVAASAVAWLLRAVPAKIGEVARTTMSSDLNVDSSNDHFVQIDGYVARHILPWTFRCFEPADRDEDSPIRHTYLNLGYGSGWGRWRGVWFSFSKTREKGLHAIQKSLIVRLWTTSRSQVEQFVNEAAHHKRGEPRQRVYASSGGGMYWTRAADKRLRSLDTVFVNDDAARMVADRVARFLESEIWYLNRGIPYKLVVLLHGPPGTGKTSLIHAVASHHGMDIDYVTQLGNLGELLGGKSNRKSVIVIEDIDTLARLEREDPDESTSSDGGATWSPNAPAAVKAPQMVRIDDPRALHDALNSLDGFTTQHGVVVFITTNHPENLDRALLRPGRVDLALEVGPLGWDAATRMFCTFYDDPTERSSWGLLDDVFRPTTGAVLQQAFMGEAIDAVESLLGTWKEYDDNRRD